MPNFNLEDIRQTVPVARVLVLYGISLRRTSRAWRCQRCRPDGSVPDLPTALKVEV